MKQQIFDQMEKEIWAIKRVAGETKNPELWGVPITCTGY